MAQYGGDQQYRREVTQTDEYGNPIRQEYETLVHSDTGVRYEREVQARQTDEFGNPVHSAIGGIDYGSTGQHVGLGQGNRGTGTGTYGTGTGHQGLGSNIGHATGVTDYDSGGRRQTGYQGGLGTEHGLTTGGTMGGTTGHHDQANRTGTGHQGLGTKIGHAIGITDYDSGSRGQTGYQGGHGTEHGLTTGETMGGTTGHHDQANRGDGTGTYGTGAHQGLGTNIGHATGVKGTDFDSGAHSTGQTGHLGLGTEPNRGTRTGTYGTGSHQGLDANKGHATGVLGLGTDYKSGGRSTGQTGYQGLGTERGVSETTNQPSATPMGGAGIGTGTKDVYSHTDTGTGVHHTDKGVMHKVKEKLPGSHGSEQQQTSTTAGYGETHEKKGIMEKIKEKLPGHH